MEASATSAVRTTPATTPRAVKRAGSVTTASSSSGSAGLWGPPVTAIPTPIISWALTTVAAIAYSGCGLRVIHGRTSG